MSISVYLVYRGRVDAVGGCERMTDGMGDGAALARPRASARTDCELVNALSTAPPAAMATIAEGFPLSTVRVISTVVAHGFAAEPRARYGGARGGWPRGEPDGGSDRQPVGETTESGGLGARRGRRSRAASATSSPTRKAIWSGWSCIKPTFRIATVRARARSIRRSTRGCAYLR